MGRRAAIVLLDPRIKEAVDAAISEGRASIDDLVELIRAHGGETSRSAVGRYKKGFEEKLGRYRETQEIAGHWVAQFRSDPNGDVGRLLAEMLKTLAFQTMAEAGGDEGTAMDPKDLGFLAKAVKDLVQVDRTKAELEARVRERTLAEAADRAATAATEAGLSKDRAAQLRRDVLGLRTQPAGGETT